MLFSSMPACRGDRPSPDMDPALRQEALRHVRIVEQGKPVPTQFDNRLYRQGKLAGVFFRQTVDKINIDSKRNSRVRRSVHDSPWVCSRLCKRLNRTLAPWGQCPARPKLTRLKPHFLLASPWSTSRLRRGFLFRAVVHPHRRHAE